jgi:hypothetical protein
MSVGKDLSPKQSRGEKEAEAGEEPKVKCLTWGMWARILHTILIAPQECQRLAEVVQIAEIHRSRRIPDVVDLKRGPC